MFEKFRLGKRGENIIFTIFILIYVAYCLNSPDMSFESFKTVLTIGLSVGIIYGLVALGISLIYTGLDVVNFSHGEFFMIGAFAGLTMFNILGNQDWIFNLFPEAYGWIIYVSCLFTAFSSDTLSLAILDFTFITFS